MIKNKNSRIAGAASAEMPEKRVSAEAAEVPVRNHADRRVRDDQARKQEFDVLRQLRAGATAAPADTAGRRAAHAENYGMFRARQAGRVGWSQQDEDDAPAHFAWQAERESPDQSRRGAAAAAPADGAFARTVVLDFDAAPPSGAPVVLPEPSQRDTLAEPPPAMDTEAPLAPEIEDASMRFANGDDAGAEAILVGALNEDAAADAHDVAIWLALFDFYRVTDQAAKFEQRAVAFAERLGRSAPQWRASRVALRTRVASPWPSDSSTGSRWCAPAVLDAPAMARLAAALDGHPQPWRIDWHPLSEIHADALPPWIATLNRWAERRVHLDFAGIARPLELLRQQAQPERSGVNPDWWLARLALLRVMNRMAEFEATALDYCATYAVSPPAWSAPQCTLHEAPEPGAAPKIAVARQDPDPSAAATVVLLGVESGLARLRLRGELLDDAVDALHTTPELGTCQAVELDCHDLRRVDFAAGGALVDWAAAQQRAGRRVELKEANRLVAAFLDVLGLPGWARVSRRTD